MTRPALSTAAAVIALSLVGSACSTESHQTSVFAFNASDQRVILDVQTEDHGPLRVVQIEPHSGGSIGDLPGDVMRATAFGSGCVYLGDGPIVPNGREALILIEKDGQPWNSDMTSDVGVRARSGGLLAVVGGCTH